MKKKKNIKTLALILMLLLGIGFAALAANLKIDGTVNVSKVSWDIHFENVEITEGSVAAATIPTSDDETTTELTYVVNFAKPGDFYEFTVDVTNDGTIDGMVNVLSNKVYSSDGITEISIPNYLKSTVTYANGLPIIPGHLLNHNTSEKIKVRLEFRTDISVPDLPSSTDDSIIFKTICNYKQADNTAIKKTYYYKTRQVANEITPNDEVCVGDECFYVVSSNADTTVLLSKYALNTNKNKQTDSAYGGSDYPYYTYFGFCKNDTRDYWKNKVGEGLDYPGSYEDPNYPNVYDENSSLYLPTEAYKNYIEDFGAVITKARQLKYTEIKEICGGLDCSSNSIINVHQFFYLNNAYSSYSVWIINGTGNVGYWTNGSGGVGLRPVFEIPTSELK